MLNRLEGVLKLTEIKIMRNSEWPPFMGHNLSPWYVFDQGTPANDISDITIKKLGRDTLFRPFFKIAATKINSSSNLHRVIILVSIHLAYVCMGNKSNETTYKKIGLFLYCEFGKIQDGCFVAVYGFHVSG